MLQPKVLPLLSYAAIVGGINTYALIVVLRTTALSHDVWVLVLTLLATTGCLLLIRPAHKAADASVAHAAMD